MSLIFKPPTTAIALWWGMAWRGILWMLIFLVPYLLAVFLFFFILAVGLLLTGVSEVHIRILVRIISLGFQNILLPVLMCGLMFWRIFKAESFSSRHASGTLRGENVTTLGTSIRYGGWFYLEVFKYSWPFLIGGIILGVFMGFQLVSGPSILGVLLFTSMLGVYLHWLILDDLIRRRTFGPCTLVVTGAGGTPTGNTPSPKRKAITRKAPAKKTKKV